MLSSDDVVHRLYEDRVVIDAVVDRFGEAVLAPDGSVDRAALGDAAFAQDGGLAFLEGLLHPRIGAAREEWVAEQRARVPPPPLLICEVPLLFEVDLADQFDAVLVVTARDEVRRARVQQRGQDFDGRSAHQMPEAEKVSRADAAFENNGSVDALAQWVEAMMARYGRPSD